MHVREDESCTRQEIVYLVDGTFMLLPDMPIQVCPDWDFANFACHGFNTGPVPGAEFFTLYQRWMRDGSVSRCDFRIFLLPQCCHHQSGSH
jgi:hypothetical protein